MPTISEERIFNIIGQLYDTAHQAASEPWIEVYREIAALVKSGWGGLTAFETREERFSVVEGTTPKSFLDEYFDYFQHVSPIRPTLAMLKPGERFNRQEFIDDPDFRDLEIYQDFYRKGGIFHLEYRVFLHHDDAHAGISFSRPDGQPNFSKSELVAITYLMPHLARAFKLHFNLLEANRKHRLVAEAFDRISQAVIVVGRDRKPVFVNGKATEVLAVGGGLRLDRSGRLETTAKDGHFQKLLANIFDRNAFEADKYGGVATVARPNGLRPLELLISPFKHNNGPGTDPETMAIIFVTDPEQKTPEVADMLGNVYGLTRTEARLAALIADGKTLAEICEEMSIMMNTVRTHLKHVFSKTATSRQSELIRLILNGHANIGSKNK